MVIICGYIDIYGISIDLRRMSDTENWKLNKTRTEAIFNEQRTYFPWGRGGII